MNGEALQEISALQQAREESERLVSARGAWEGHLSRMWGLPVSSCP